MQIKGAPWKGDVGQRDNRQIAKRCVYTGGAHTHVHAVYLLMMSSLHHINIGIDKWFPLTPISKDDSVQGEILVEMTMEQYTEVSDHE